jgi:hypothetical protein
MAITVLGIDLGKNSCSVVGLDGSGAVVLRRRLHRENVIKLASDLAPLRNGDGACCGAHHLGRILARSGTPGPADITGVCSALREVAQERRLGCRSDRGGGDTANDAIC